MLPLAGVRIIAVEVYGAGPFGSAHLADLGAEVIKIEPREGGEVSRLGDAAPELAEAIDWLMVRNLAEVIEDEGGTVVRLREPT